MFSINKTQIIILGPNWDEITTNLGGGVAISLYLNMIGVLKSKTYSHVHVSYIDLVFSYIVTQLLVYNVRCQTSYPTIL